MAPPDRRAAVLGHPVSHSLSPTLHRAAYKHLGLNWSYEAVDVTSEQLPDFIRAIVEAPHESWAGLSLTMPLKEVVIPLLSSIDSPAEALRSVNTVTFGEAGSRGWNTDVHGLAEVLRHIDFDTSSATTILGAGATARSAVGALAEVASGPVTICARRSEAAAELVALAEEFGLAAGTGSWPPSAKEISVPIVVSTLPVEAQSQALVDVPGSLGHLVDVVYDPWPSPLARLWQGAGGQVTGGLAMLVCQAVEQVRLMTGLEVDPDILRLAGLQALQERGIAQGEQ